MIVIEMELQRVSMDLYVHPINCTIHLMEWLLRYVKLHWVDAICTLSFKQTDDTFNQLRFQAVNCRNVEFSERKFCAYNPIPKTTSSKFTTISSALIIFNYSAFQPSTPSKIILWCDVNVYGLVSVALSCNSFDVVNGGQWNFGSLQFGNKWV